MGKITLSSVLIVWIVLINFHDGTAQYINAPGGQDEKYQNYAEEGYKNYSQEFITLKHYDNFGNFLLEGLNVYNLSDPHPASSSGILKERVYTNWFENLVLVQDNYKGFATSIMVGDAVRTKFTSLTLDRARFNGVRWDGSTMKNRVTLVYSRVSDPIFSPFKSQLTSRLTAEHKWNRFLYGGHWETEIGDILRFGTTYVNLHQANSEYDSKDTSLRGAVAVSRPEYIILRFRDDSPTDGFGSRVFAAPEMYVNGQLTDIAPYQQYIYPVSANGAAYLDLRYKIPRDANAIQFHAVVANDYLIQMAHEFYEDPSAPTYLVRSNFMTVARAEGNVNDESNKQMLVLDYALNTGRSIYGIDFTANILGFHLKGEYETNVSYSKYPVLPGKDYSETSHAYFFQGKRRFGPLTIGGEYFKIDPNYFTSLSTFSRDRVMSGLEDDLIDTYRAPTTSVDDSVGAHLTNGGIYDWLVDDNDDNDRYHDGYYYWTVRDPKMGSDAALAYKTNKEETFNRTAPEPDAGIFPGLDENNDGIPDDNQNSNDIPDYDEPFLMYYRDHPRFDFGDDWNNNDYIDNRENDREPDHIYRRDQKGHHSFLSLELIKNLDFSVGFFRTQQIAGGGRNDINYGKIEYDMYLPRWGKIQLKHISKRVHDDIADDTYQWIDGEMMFVADPLSMRNSMVHTSFLQAQILRIPNLTIEPLKVKYEHNAQKSLLNWDGSVAQDDKDVIAWRVVNKIDYKYQIRDNLVLMPQLKHRYELQYRNYEVNGKAKSDTLIHEQTLIPIIRLDYTLTPKTVLRMGFQGFSIEDIHRKLSDGGIFSYKKIDKKIEGNSHRDKIFMIMLTSSGDYSGYKLAFNIGYQNVREIYYKLDPSQQIARNKSYNSIFVRVLAGW
ncbi:hypothetical protein JXJ21_16940 [candidate division KSB1 bacterium]|nr:hypothetical protein [candidate division KSB1 bacterium]